MGTANRAAVSLGRRGGKAGTGPSKRRTPEQYATIQALALETRRVKAKVREDYPSVERVRIVRGGERDGAVDAFGPMPNTDIAGWYFFGWLADVLRDALA
jgi:hypothetical protein